MKISLTALERIARAADKELPGSLYSFDPHGGWDAPGGDAVEEHIDASDPATMISLIRRIRELEQALEDQLGEGPSALRTLLEKGTTRYGRHPVGCDDDWDIDSPAEDEQA